MKPKKKYSHPLMGFAVVLFALRPCLEFSLDTPNVHLEGRVSTTRPNSPERPPSSPKPPVLNH